MKILNANQIRQWDAFTIKNEPISSLDLMERASSKCVNWLVRNFDPSYRFHVVSGMGNNGGDGLAIARLLIDKGYDCQVSIIKYKENGSEDFEVNLNKILDFGGRLNFVEDGKINLTSNEIVIDTLFGTGLNKPLVGQFADIIEKINQTATLIVSIDIPSGMFVEDNSENEGVIIKAQFTLTFQAPKLAFLLPQTGNYVGAFEVLDIGLSDDFLPSVDSNYHFVTDVDIAHYNVPRDKFNHKGNFGHALLIAGEKGKIGAAVLASKACLRSGVGLLTSFVPEVGCNIMQTSIPEAMCLTADSENTIPGIPDISNYSAVGIGPGIGTSNSAQGSLKLLIQESKRPLVIDADGLNILADNKTWLSFLAAGSILTPHLGEFKRLVGDFKSDIERVKGLSEFSIKHKVIVVLKGAHSMIASPDGQVYFNSTGNPGMATAGSGDVLTGIITSLLAQGYNPLIAACMGVYYHGLAGDMAAGNLGEASLLSGDIIDYLPMAFEK
ncbi:MAG: NAD(P)H-hydrate dehydratase [Salibacteraceae bacterium]